MTGKREPEKSFSLARWSRRKLEATRDAPPSAAPAAAAPAAPALPETAAASAPVELPPVESLTFDSDFTAFLRPDVDADLKRAALKQLFRDPRFNVMDGLDTYIDDYTKADPIPEDMLAGLMQRFARVAASDEAPAVAAGEHESGDTPADATPASGEGVLTEQSASEGNVPSLGNAHERAAAAGTGDAAVTSVQDDAQSSAHEVVPPIARNDNR